MEILQKILDHSDKMAAQDRAAGLPGNSLRDTGRQLKDLAVGAVKAVTTDTPGMVQDFLDWVQKKPAVEGGNSAKMFEAVTGIKSSGGTDELIGSLIDPSAAVKGMIVGAARLASKTGKINMEEVNNLAMNFASREELYNKTGAYTDKDSKFKAVISDKDAKLSTDAAEGLSTGGFPASGAKLPAVLKHPELYELYPELSRVRVLVSEGKPGEGSFSDKYGVITVSPNSNIDELRSTILHEAQHAVQAIEGFSRGTNINAQMDPKMFKAEGALYRKREAVLKRRDSAEIDAFDRFQDKINNERYIAGNRYMNNPGEQEARFTQAARNLGDMSLESQVLKLLKEGDTPQTWDTRNLQSGIPLREIR